MSATSRSLIVLIVAAVSALCGAVAGWITARDSPSIEHESRLRDVEGLMATRSEELRKSEELIARLSESSRVLEQTVAEHERQLRILSQSAPSSALVATGGAVEAGPNEDGEDAESQREDEKQMTIETALERILDPNADWDSREPIWQELRDAGLFDDALTLLEARAKAASGDAAVQTTLGTAYIQKLLSTSNDAEKGTWAMKADAAFNRALAVDDHHWEARFNKAVSYSFFPPIFGFQPKAVEQFEILVEQQEAAPEPRPEHAQSYLYLGNLYATQNRRDDAAATWRRGAERFPDSTELAERAAEAAEPK
jgi:tetratricopeptide (TPR) repeat protein